MSVRRSRQRLWVVFAAPIALGVLSLIGLFAALTGDGWRDILSWVALGAPVLTILWAFRARAA